MKSMVNLLLDREFDGQFPWSWIPWSVYGRDHEFHSQKWAWLTTAIVLISVPRSWNPWSICSLIVNSMVGLFSVPWSWIPWSVMGVIYHGHISWISFFLFSMMSWISPTNKILCACKWPMISLLNFRKDQGTYSIYPADYPIGASCIMC